MIMRIHSLITGTVLTGLALFTISCSQAPQSGTDAPAAEAVAE